MKSVGARLESKVVPIACVRPDATVYDALTLMATRDVGAVLVMDGQALVGILSERDCARRVILPGKNARWMMVATVMTPRVVCVRARVRVSRNAWL